MPFCKDCKKLVRMVSEEKTPDGTVRRVSPPQWRCACPGKRHETSGANPHRTEAVSTPRVFLEAQADARPQQSVTCPKCGHDKAYFHLMQTRRSDEPPTQINECVKCGHGWRDYQ